MSQISRHTCCCCGRKLKSFKLKRNNNINSFSSFFKISWRSYPRINSYKCILNCIPYAQDVHKPSVKNK